MPLAHWRAAVSKQLSAPIHFYFILKCHRGVAYSIYAVYPHHLLIKGGQAFKVCPDENFVTLLSECVNASDRRVLKLPLCTKPKREAALVLSQKVQKAPENSGAFL